MSERDDVAAARRGEPEAFGRLVRRHLGAVCAVATAVLGDPAAGEEVAHEAFVAAWSGLGRLAEPERFGAWVRGIARNRAREALRGRARRREVGGDALGAVPDPSPDPGDRLDGARAEATLWSALQGLDEDHREVLVLYYREGRSVQQVAGQLELPEPTVRKRLSRARERLREGVEERLGERLARTAPRAAAFAAGVGAALAPRSARAAGLGTALLAAGGLGAVAAAAWLAAVLGDLPPVPPPPVVTASAASTAARAAPGSVPDPAEVPLHVVHAFLAAEDARFFEHGAVDPWALGRAAWNDAQGGPLQGGSTLTQQLAKGMLLAEHPERGLSRKVAEVALAVELERAWSKDQILAAYLDQVWMGSGARGVTAAATAYFGCPPGDLTLGQAALLAGMAAGPAAYGPGAPGAVERRAWVLDRMVANGWATPAEAAAARAEPSTGT